MGSPMSANPVVFRYGGETPDERIHPRPPTFHQSRRFLSYPRLAHPPPLQRGALILFGIRPEASESTPGTSNPASMRAGAAEAECCRSSPPGPPPRPGWRRGRHLWRSTHEPTRKTAVLPQNQPPGILCRPRCSWLLLPVSHPNVTAPIARHVTRPVWAGPGFGSLPTCDVCAPWLSMASYRPNLSLPPTCIRLRSAKFIRSPAASWLPNGLRPSTPRPPSPIPLPSAISAQPKLNSGRIVRAHHTTGCCSRDLPPGRMEPQPSVSSRLACAFRLLASAYSAPRTTRKIRPPSLRSHPMAFSPQSGRSRRRPGRPGEAASQSLCRRHRSRPAHRDFRQPARRPLTHAVLVSHTSPTVSRVAVGLP